MNKAVIFDMDGVICHTNPHHSVAFKEFFAKREMYPTEGEFEKHMYGKSNSYIMSHFFGRKIEGDELKDLEEEKEGLFRDMYKEKIEAIAGFEQFLDELKSAGIKTGVATSAPMENMKMIGDKLNLFSKMESYLASEDVNKHKPDPEIYLKTAHNLAIEVQNCIVFEDSFSGVSAAKNAGMRVVGVLSSHTKEELPPCDLYISDYKDLKVEHVIDLIQ